VLADSGTRMGLAVDELVIIPVGTGMRLFNRTSLFRILMDVSAHADFTQLPVIGSAPAASGKGS
jgi:hypothetical protein